jgi:hypothetical protein
VTLKGGKSEVEQQARDLSAVQPDWNSVKEFAGTDAVVSKFLGVKGDWQAEPGVAADGRPVCSFRDVRISQAARRWTWAFGDWRAQVMWRILANSLFAVIVQLVVGLLLGGIVLWALGEFGWESPRTIWTVIVLMLVVLAVNLASLRARITRLEKQAGEQKKWAPLIQALQQTAAAMLVSRGFKALGAAAVCWTRSFDTLSRSPSARSERAW